MKISSGGGFTLFTARNYKGGTAFTYHSERVNTRATHIQCCPREPRERVLITTVPLLTELVRATASGYVTGYIAVAGRLVKCAERWDNGSRERNEGQD